VSFRLPEGRDETDLPDVGGSLVSQGLESQVRTASPTTTLHRLTEWAIGTGVELDALTVTRPSLEDVYLELVGGELSAPTPVTVANSGPAAPERMSA
jgi:ABC-2 type transport system ATP-binding protein